MDQIVSFFIYFVLLSAAWIGVAALLRKRRRQRRGAPVDPARPLWRQDADEAPPADRPRASSP